MELEEAKEYLRKFNDLTFSWSLKEKCELNKAIETVLQALNDKDKQLQEISDEFLKYDWANSNSIQINNQLKSLYFSIFRKEKNEGIKLKNNKEIREDWRN